MTNAQEMYHKLSKAESQLETIGLAVGKLYYEISEVKTYLANQIKKEEEEEND